MAADERVSVDLSGHVSAVEFSAESDEGLLVEVSGAQLTLVGAQGFSGESAARITARDDCGNASETTVEVLVGAGAACPTEFRYTARGAPDGVAVAGSFNRWSSTETPMQRDGAEWVATVDLPEGAHTYKFVEQTVSTASEAWSCDPLGDAFQCDEGYSWDPSCPVGGGGCNSLVVVQDCSIPVLSLDLLTVDRVANTVAVEVSGDVTEIEATLDGAPIEGWDGSRFLHASAPLTDGRHTLRFNARDRYGRAAEEVYVPVWLDDRDWAGGLMYWVFVDRFADGDATRNASEGTSAASTDYLGGDWQGVIDRLDYLESLGVTVLWLTAPQDNAEGAWEGSCDETYSGYHGYWPADSSAVEEHFGDEAKLRELIAAAHGRNMRVLTDWAANHVHADHPWVAEHPGWFNSEAICEDADNWNDIPETCWFAPYLPDIRYSEVEPLLASVDDAVSFAKKYELDGYRVDAVKHMPHSLHFDFASRADAELEHGVEDFYTVGETFSGDRGLIASYIGGGELDGQFDFPLYWAIVSAFARDEIGLSDGDGSLASVVTASNEAFAGHLMSVFLGNHDVTRFIAMAAGEVGSLYGDSVCGDDGALRTPDIAPAYAEPYQRLMLAWTFLLTTEGLPVIYYGDEIGLPGYGDPDNRQAMRFDDALGADEAAVLAHVQALGQARRTHPAFSRGTRTEWWGGEPGFWGYARVHGDDAVIVLLNRDDASRTVTNGLAFAGLPEGTYTDVLTGDTFVSDGDVLTVDVPALGSRVLTGG